jgi:NTF2-related export protein 1/2
MFAPNEDTLTKVSTDAAMEFVQSFYTSLQSNRGAISTFYSPANSTILFNGNVVAGGAAVQDIFVNQMPPTHYEVQSLDCQVINQKYPTATATGVKRAAEKSAKDISILVTVSGYAKFGVVKNASQRVFSETFALVPAPTNSLGGVAKGKGGKGWLIQSQNFRLVV